MKEKFANSVEKFENYFNTTISVSVKEERARIHWEAVRTLTAVGVLPSECGKRYMCLFTSEETGTEIAKIEFAHFPNSVGYIHWIWVNTDFRREGVASHIRSDVIEFLETKTNSIYSKTMSDYVQKIARQQGFTRIEYGDLEGWMLRE